MNVPKAKKHDFRSKLFQADGSLDPCKKAPISGAFLHGASRGFSPPDLLRAVHELPGSPGDRRARAVVEHTRKPGLRGRSLRRSPLGSRAPRGEDSSEPVPRPLPGASGTVRSGNGRVDSPIHPQKPNQKTIWFGFCFVLIFNTYARLGIAGGFAKATPSQALARPATALPGAKRLQKTKKPTCLGEALAETEACLSPFF